MKDKRMIVFLIITNIILLGIICTLISGKKNVIKEKQVIKEMSESAQITDLNNQINALNAEHSEYMNYIETCKIQIATALTNEKVPTSNQAKLETMAENISKVLQARTSDATATADNISEGKTAYVNGKKIVGNGSDTKVVACEYLTVTCDGLAYGVDYYTSKGSNSATSRSVITVTPSGATVSNSGNWGNTIYGGDSDLARYYCKANGLNIVKAECATTLPAKASFSFKKVTLDCTLTATFADTYTDAGSASTSVNGTIVINSDGTITKSNFVSGWSGTVYSKGLARYQCRTTLKVNNCIIE